MAQRHRASHGSLFLMELIFSILLFSIIATICISGFVKSHALSRDASLQTHYATITGSFAEVVRSTDSWSETVEAIGTYYPKATYVDSNDTEQPFANADAKLLSMPLTLHIYFDDSFALCDSNHASYCMEVEFSEDNDLLVSDIGVRVGGNTAHVYDLRVEHFYHE